MEIKTSYEWINARIKTLIRIFSDILLFFILIIICNINLPLIINLIFILFVININYIFGKYHDLLIDNFFNYLKYFFIDFFLIFFYFNFLILLKKIFINEIDIQNLNQFSYVLIIIIISNSLLRYKQLRYKTNHKKLSHWIFYGKIENFEILLSEINFEKNIYKVTYVDNLNNLNKFNNYDGIIYDHDVQEIPFLGNYLFSKKINLTIDQWLEKYYQKLPTIFINKNNIYSILNNLLDKKMQLRIKRLFDLILSMILLIITSPLILIASIIIFLQDYNSPFYKQTRTGLNCKPITIYKLRTMKQNAEKNGVQWSRGNDIRVTFIGKFLRKSRIDELPQLISVIRGDMALIGPRPERPEIDIKLNEVIFNYKLRYSIKPGLSGWAQVNFPYGASIKDSEIKLGYDVFYLKNFSLLLDLLIFFKTIKLVFNAKGSVPIEDKR